jgi:hypothetical protein
MSYLYELLSLVQNEVDKKEEILQKKAEEHYKSGKRRKVPEKLDKS